MVLFIYENLNKFLVEVAIMEIEGHNQISNEDALGTIKEINITKK